MDQDGEGEFEASLSPSKKKKYLIENSRAFQAPDFDSSRIHPLISMISRVSTFNSFGVSSTSFSSFFLLLMFSFSIVRIGYIIEATERDTSNKVTLRLYEKRFFEDEVGKKQFLAIVNSALDSSNKLIVNINLFFESESVYGIVEDFIDPEDYQNLVEVLCYRMITKNYNFRDEFVPILEALVEINQKCFLMSRQFFKPENVFVHRESGEVRIRVVDFHCFNERIDAQPPFISHVSLKINQPSILFFPQNVAIFSFSRIFRFLKKFHFFPNFFNFEKNF